LTRTKQKRPKFGDGLEIPTPKGFCLPPVCESRFIAWSIDSCASWFFLKRPENFSSIVLQQEQCFTFFPVSAAVNRGIVTIMANEAIPESARKMPVLRTPGGIDKRGKILNWWILDGESKQLVSELSAEQKNLSIASVMNDTMLVHRIVEGWSPSDWV